MSKSHIHDSPHLPVPRVRRILRPLARFLEIESASGVVLIACTVIALILANSAFAHDYEDFWDTHVGIQIGNFSLGGPLGHFFINDVLMALFFFVVGLEIKRELVAGELRDPRKAALPVMAALGGMLVPAVIYMSLQSGQPGFRGWGIPMATDIAFVVGIMALLGPGVPFGLKIMLLSLAIADDIGAVVVIAIFYSSALNWTMLGLAALGFGVIYLLNRLEVRTVGVYAVLGVFTWLAMFRSGVHPTIAGVVIGLMTPAGVWISQEALRLSIADLAEQLEHESGPEPGELETVAYAARESVSPLERLEHRLHPWVGFLIMPLFALANAGVQIEAGAMTDPVAMSVALGLFLGKPIGVLFFSFIAVNLGLARLPQGVNWWVLLGGGFLAGIGFTMSLFVADLALGENKHLLDAGKIGTLGGSMFSAVVGTVILLVALRKRRTE